MITITPVIRSTKNTEYLPLHLRIIINRKKAFVKTHWMAKREWILPDGTITDAKLRKAVWQFIDYKMEELNRLNPLTAKEAKEIIEGDSSVSFTQFAQEYIPTVNVKRWDLWHQASKSLHTYVGKTDVKFSDLTVKTLQGWYDSLSGTKRIATMYPRIVRSIYIAGMRKYNDPDKGSERIKPYPDEYLQKPYQAPKVQKAASRTLSSEQIRQFATCDLSFGGMNYTDAREWVRAVCMLSFCLAGMNTADIFDLKKADLKDGRICYFRAKTKEKRPDGAYMEVTIPEQAYPFFNLLKDDDSEYLFTPASKFKTSKDFYNSVNKVLKTISRELKFPPMTGYSFRYSFASIAVNECGVPLEEVAFALNHATAHRITAGYVKKDFSRVDRVIDAVLNKVFS